MGILDSIVKSTPFGKAADALDNASKSAPAPASQPSAPVEAKTP